MRKSAKNPNKCQDVCDWLLTGNYVPAMDAKYIKINKITHIINTAPKKCPNLFNDYKLKHNPIIFDIFKSQSNQSITASLIGKISYLNINGWDEHRVKQISKPEFIY